MARWLLAAFLLATPLSAQDSQTPQKKEELKRERPRPSSGQQAGKDEAPPEEDESVAPTKFAFNPLQSVKDVRVGDFYFKQRNYHAALGRYRDATQWNPDNSEAWLRMGEAAEKSKDPEIAREAYGRYLKLEPEAKNAADIRKKLAKLK